MKARNHYEVRFCEETRKFALYRAFPANAPGAMTGRELIAHEHDFHAISDALIIHDMRSDEELIQEGYRGL